MSVDPNITIRRVGIQRLILLHGLHLGKNFLSVGEPDIMRMIQGRRAGLSAQTSFRARTMFVQPPQPGFGTDMSDLDQLRKALQRITDEPDVTAHQKKIDALSFPNSIKRLPDSLVTNFYQYFDFVKCLAFAFRLHELQDYHRYEPRIAHAGWVECTVALLADHPKKYRENIKPDDLVVYFDEEGKPVHTGSVDDDVALVRSKWGMGNIYQHGVYEVPESYGNDARYYEPPPHDTEERLNRYLNRRSNQGAT